MTPDDNWNEEMTSAEVEHEMRMRKSLASICSAPDMSWHADLDNIAAQIDAGTLVVGDDQEDLSGGAASSTIAGGGEEGGTGTRQASVDIDPDRQFYPLPREAKRAWYRKELTLNQIRGVSSRSFRMQWDVDVNAGGAVPENWSKNSIGIEELPRAVVDNHLGRNWPKFPANVPDRLLQAHRAGTAALPGWKNLGAGGAGSLGDELVFGLRVTSLLGHGATVLASEWRDDANDEAVGFLSVDMTGDAARRFLDAQGGQPAKELRKGLLRALKGASGDVEAVAVWVRVNGDPERVRLFLAMRLEHDGGVKDAVTLDTALRYKEQQDDPSAVDWWEYRGVASDCRTTEDESRARAARIWTRIVRSFGMPSWFSAEVLDDIRNYLLRDPMDLKLRKEIVATKKRGYANKMIARQLAKLELKEMAADCGMRFYRGSPAQFAAMVFSSGEVLGSYSDSRHKAGEAKLAYESIRASI